MYQIEWADLDSGESLSTFYRAKRQDALKLAEGTSRRNVRVSVLDLRRPLPGRRSPKLIYWREFE